ncbi:MAG: hypothetical protein IT320_23115 [Anaerolineae bacterium]|nr:hypothetical protein [Anaerolineae bacterium]
MLLANLRERLFRMLPLLLLLTILLALVLFAVTSILPAWNTYDALQKDLVASEGAAGTHVADLEARNDITVVQRQLNLAQARLDDLGKDFLTDNEAEAILDRLYSRAYARGVRILSMQAQPPQVIDETSPFALNVFQLQVEGPAANLIDFLAHVREALLPSVQIENINTVQNRLETVMTMNVIMYTSRYAPGNALEDLDEIVASEFTSTPSPSPTLSPTPSSTPTSTLTPTRTPTPTATPTLTLTPTATITPTPSPTDVIPTATETSTPEPTAVDSAQVPEATTVQVPGAGDQVACDASMPSRFTVGAVAVVDFNGPGALRVFSVNFPQERTQTALLYDNDRVRLEDGSICILTNGLPVHFWRIRSLDAAEIVGWVGEGTSSEPWLCPENRPECA